MSVGVVDEEIVSMEGLINCKETNTECGVR